MYRIAKKLSNVKRMLKFGTRKSLEIFSRQKITNRKKSRSFRRLFKKRVSLRSTEEPRMCWWLSTIISFLKRSLFGGKDQEPYGLKMGIEILDSSI